MTDTRQRRRIVRPVIACARFANRVKLGPSACAGRWMPMGRLDDIVVDALAMHLLQPTRLHVLLQSWMDRSEEAVAPPGRSSSA